MQDRRLPRGTLIVFKEWIPSKAITHENLLAQAGSSFDRNKFQSRDKTKTSTFASNAEESSETKNLEYPFKDEQHPIWTSEKLKSMKVNERREHVRKFRLCFSCLRPGHMSAKSGHAVCPIVNKNTTRLSTAASQKKEATIVASDATTAVATMITHGGLPVVRTKLMNGNHSLSLLPICDTGSSISFVVKSIISSLQPQDRKASLSVAGIHGSKISRLK